MSNYSSELWIILHQHFSGSNIDDAIDSANALKAVGYVIITIGHGTPNNFSALASDPSYAFSIYPNDPPNYADEAKVSAAVSNILGMLIKLASTRLDKKKLFSWIEQ